MSADNWAICPRCRATRDAARQAKIQAAADAYGKVPAEEYERLKAEAAQPPEDLESQTTFREDYEFYGAEDGTIRASYSGGCDRCGLSVEMKCEKTFYEEEV